MSACAYVGSQTHIYNDTLRNNLTLWNEAITDTHIKEALERVNLLSFLSRIDEQVSDGSFSEGQKQRIGLIRAFLKGSSVVIFDEATANLDHKNATRIEHLLLNDPNITYITVTHHLIKENELYFDEIIRLGEGTEEMFDMINQLWLVFFLLLALRLYFNFTNGSQSAIM